MGLFKGARNCVHKIGSALGFPYSSGLRSRDRASVELPGLRMELERCSSDTTPHEVTLVLPRVEIRRATKGPEVETTEEYVYSSLTVVHAPRHPQASGGDQAASIDNEPAVVYTLRRWSTMGSKQRQRNAALDEEVGSYVVDRRDPSS